MENFLFQLELDQNARIFLPRVDVIMHLPEGWEEFVQKHKLGAMDVIRFYKPVNPSHKKHFLIEILKSSGWGANRAGPRQGGGSEGNEIARE
ncbi:hypothetical protein RHSIM_Rhsim13G0097200 [Rhododendron simsii]|uniref:TF-B3 domain-containing protein n=1 Tax=Rhododendron simsii TaxID=118357 RepID=A0A834G190_RHOSS|nr:hypothetical protein RHSIM_Rhsim13G0097200 [Rhododendron simsii]